MPEIRIFCCYAHEDRNLLRRLKTHLYPLQRGKIISSIWYDQNITAGSVWEEEIKAQLNTSNIVLLLVSADFLASEYCYGVEMKLAIERHERGEAIVIPIILKPAFWQETPFYKLQALPPGAKPVTEWETQDQAFNKIAEGINLVAQQLGGLESDEEQNYKEMNTEAQKDAPKTDCYQQEEDFITNDTISFHEEASEQIHTENKLIFLRSNIASIEELLDIGTETITEAFVREVEKTIRQAIMEFRKLSFDERVEYDEVLENLRQARIQAQMAIDAIPSLFLKSIFDQRKSEDFYRRVHTCREYLERALRYWIVEQ
jgi:TIR domain